MEVRVKRSYLACALVFVSCIAIAGTPALVPFKGANATVSFPKGWVVQQDSGVYAAQQDPMKKDAAGILFLYTPNSNNATEDQLLDGVASKVAQDVAVGERAAISGGIGHYMIADGVSDGTKVRIAALAVVTNGQAIVSVFVAKTADFDALGGLTLASVVMGSFKPNTTPTPAPAPAEAPAPAPATGAVTIHLSDLVGKWGNNGASTLSYVDADGNYSGSSTAFFGEWYTFKADGSYTMSFQGRANNHTIRETGAGRVTFSGDLLIFEGTREGAPSMMKLRLLGFQTAKDGTAVLTLLDAQYPLTEGNIGLYKEAWIRDPENKK